MLPHLSIRCLVLSLLLALLIPRPVTAQDAPSAQVDPASQTLPLPLTGIADVAGGTLHTCAVTTGGAAFCWGDNQGGQVGDGQAPTDRTAPTAVVGLDGGISAVTAGSAHSCALTTGGGVQCWGNNGFGQLGNGDMPTSTDTPVAVTGLDSGVTVFATGNYHTCAVLAGGGVRCWGNDSDGQLGNGGPLADSDVPVAVALGSAVATLAAGSYHTCAVTTLGAARCWGDNVAGQLGNNNAPTDSSAPVNVSGLDSGVVAIAAGIAHTCALTTGGGVQCWGDNFYGQLGSDNAPTDSEVPVDVYGLETGVIAIRAGGNHSCALTASGRVLCWGRNNHGQLGDGNVPASRGRPGDVTGLPGGVTAVAAAVSHTCAIRAGGRLECWGYNSDGQLGDGTFIAHSQPIDVLTPTTCYQLTRNRIGSGAVPAADPANTPGCPANHYLPGQLVTLFADSNADSRVSGWAGTANNATLNEINFLTMPGQDHAVSVTYESCFALTAVVVGQGDPLTAMPPSSIGCAAGAYVAGQAITLTAAPASGWTIQGWGGTADNASIATTNALTMPPADHIVGVTYVEGAADLFLPSIQR